MYKNKYYTEIGNRILRIFNCGLKFVIWYLYVCEKNKYCV